MIVYLNLFSFNYVPRLPFIANALTHIYSPEIAITSISIRNSCVLGMSLYIIAL